MCSFMDNLQSRITPKFLTLFTNGKTLEPICTAVGRSLSELEVATRRASVLPSFNCSLFWTIQLIKLTVFIWVMELWFSAAAANDDNKNKDEYDDD